MSFLRKALVPALGAGLLFATVVQIRAQRVERRPIPALAPVSEPGSRVNAEGRLVAYPGAQVVVGTDLAGTLIRLSAEEKQEVKRGQLLAELRADDFAAGIAEARARLEEAEADLRLYETEVLRHDRLAADGVIAQQSADLRRRDRDAALARRATAQAVIRRLEAERAKTKIVAPIDGVVLRKSVERGETVEAGQELLTLADLSRTRIEAEVDEFDAARVALGQSVTVTAEGYSERSWRGRVEEIPDSVTARQMRPQDPGRPQDTRVLRVKIALVEPTPLRLGQRVEVVIGGE